jgi:rifampicin phosphotransferase
MNQSPHASTTATLQAMFVPIEYRPPGPGAWVRDKDHQATPRGVLMQELFEPAWVAGTRTCFSRYGFPIDRLDGGHVNGWFYFRAVPAGVPDNGKEPPPAPLLKVLTRLLPELRRRRRTAAETVGGRRWLADARAWTIERESWMARADSLLAVDLTSLDDGELADHTQTALALASGMLRRHFELLGASVAVGRLLLAGRTWALTPTHLISALQGSSPASSQSRTTLIELASAAAGTQVDTTETLRGVSARAADLVDHYLRRYGWQPLGADLEAPTLAEFPDQLVELVRAQTDASFNTADVDLIDELRQQVPTGSRVEFDRLVAEAQECYACLDDNSGITAWTFGVLKRAVLEVSRRARERDAITNDHDAFNLSSSELLVLATGGRPVTAEALAERREQRAAAAAEPSPVVLGGPPVSPPDPSVFPRPIAELAAAMGAYLDQKLTPAPSAMSEGRTGSLAVAGEPVAHGVPVVAGTVTGRVVVSNDPADAIQRIEPGDILVCPFTLAAHNAIFPMLGGVFTQFGGPLGHTAVMAREFGIPAVVGAGSLPQHLDGRDGTLTVPPPI